MSTLELLIGIAVIGIFVLEVIAILERTKPWLNDRQRFFRGLLAQWNYKMFEDEATRRFLIEHEVPRFDNLISYNTQKLNQIIAKTKSIGYRNNESDKLKIQALKDNIEGYKEAKNADIILASKTKNARAMLNAKVEHIKRKMLNSSIADELEVPKEETLEADEKAEQVNE